MTNETFKSRAAAYIAGRKAGNQSVAVRQLSTGRWVYKVL